MSGRRWVVKSSVLFQRDTWCWVAMGSTGQLRGWTFIRGQAHEFTDLAAARAVAKRNPGCKVYRVRGT